VVAELVVAELVEASKHRSIETTMWDMAVMVVSTGSTTEKSCEQNAVVELVVAELVEASKRLQERANQDGGFDRLNHQKAFPEPVEGNKAVTVVSTGSTTAGSTTASTSINDDFV